MQEDAAELARRLARRAEAVCRQYLSNGRRHGRYWHVGNTSNAPGRSLYVRLLGPDRGRGAAGKWRDAATGEHGDLLDLIAANRGLAFGEALAEARRFLALPDPDPRRSPSPRRPDTARAARRLFEAAQPPAGTLAERYLLGRGIGLPMDVTALRFHPTCFYRREDGASGRYRHQRRPAMLAAVTDLAGRLTGIQRTYLRPSARRGAPPVATDRRALGRLLGHGVRFGRPDDVMVAGEGIETVLSFHAVLPAMPLVAALSAAHLAALVLPPDLRRLYVACDRDDAGRRAADRLARRARVMRIEAIVLMPMLGDFNDDLVRRGPAALAATLVGQLHPDDLTRYMVMPSAAARFG